MIWLSRRGKGVVRPVLHRSALLGASGPFLGGSSASGLFRVQAVININIDDNIVIIIIIIMTTLLLLLPPPLLSGSQGFHGRVARGGRRHGVKGGRGPKTPAL